MTAADHILIVTSKFDPHADRVIGHLRDRGIAVFRLNTDDFHAEIQVAATDRGLVLRDRWGRGADLPEGIRRAWHRKPVAPAAPAGIADPAAQRLVAGETAALIEGLGAIPGLAWVNNPHDIARARHKLPQLALARTLGLTVPRTLATNDPAQARAFAASIGGPVVCKALREVGFGDEHEWHSLFARPVPPDLLAANLAAVANCPTLFQEYTPKSHELRVTIIGEALFCCRIDSQAVPGAEADWRRADPFSVPYAIVPLDPGIEAALRAMLAHYRLRFGAFDLIVTPTGEHVFLELNPNGQFLWIELVTGAPLTRAMADLLAG